MNEAGAECTLVSTNVSEETRAEFTYINNEKRRMAMLDSALKEYKMYANSGILVDQNPGNRGVPDV